MKLNFKHFSYLLLAAGMLLVGCSKSSTEPEGGEGTQTEVSNDNSIAGFSFKKEQNPTLTESKYTSKTDNKLIFITVPEGVDLTKLVPNFTIHPKAVAKIGGKVVKSDSSVVDFSKTQTLSVTSESGISKQYQVLVRNGNARLDAKVYTFMLRHELPGVSVAISKDEEIVYAAGYGFADRDKKVRADENTLFRLASMSKQHAAIAIMSLYEKGLVNLDDKVFGAGGVLEEMFGDGMSSAWKRMTVRDILSHSSGIGTDCIFGSSTYANKNTKERVALLLKNVTPAYAIGRYSYNNSNFGIAGLIVEQITGKAFMDYLKEDVYGPAGIHEIYGGKNTQADKRENECVYYGQGGKNPYGNDVEAGVAAGGVIASTTELMRLMARIDGSPKVEDILKPETIELMCTAKAGMVSSTGAAYKKYALGWRCNYTDYPSWTAFHGGTLAGVATIWARSKTNVNGVILCNSRSYDMDIDDEMWDVLVEIQNMFNN